MLPRFFNGVSEEQKTLPVSSSPSYHQPQMYPAQVSFPYPSLDQPYYNSQPMNHQQQFVQPLPEREACLSLPPMVVAQRADVEAAYKSAKKWNKVVFFVSLALIVLGILYIISGFLIFIAVIAFDCVRESLEKLPFELNVNESMIGLGAVIVSLIGGGLILQGASGMRDYDKPTIRQARVHLARCKMCLVFFGILYTLKIFAEIKFVADIGNSLEAQLHLLPSLAEQHNKLGINPHIVLLYSNGTTLFDEEVQTLEKPLTAQKNSVEYTKDSIGDHTDESMYNYGQRGNVKRSHNNNYVVYDIDEAIHYDSRTNILKIKVDSLQGRIKKLFVVVYLVCAALELLMLGGICGCIVCCNQKYKRSCDNVEWRVNMLEPTARRELAPARSGLFTSESQIELTSFNEDL